MRNIFFALFAHYYAMPGIGVRLKELSEVESVDKNRQMSEPNCFTVLNGLKFF